MHSQCTSVHRYHRSTLQRDCINGEVMNGGECAHLRRDEAPPEMLIWLSAISLEPFLVSPMRDSKPSRSLARSPVIMMYESGVRRNVTFPYTQYLQYIQRRIFPGTASTLKPEGTFLYSSFPRTGTSCSFTGTSKC